MSLLPLLFVVVLFLITLLVWSVVANLWMGVPYVATPLPVINAMIHLANIQAGETVFDLGAGDGRVMVATKQTQPQASVHGYEITPTVFLWGKLRTWFSGSGVGYEFGNAFRHDLSAADVIFVYLSPALMRALLPKFQRELRAGTRIVSHAFTLPGRDPTETVTVRVGKREKMVRLYVW